MAAGATRWTLVEDTLCVSLIAIEIHANLVQDSLEVFDDL
jgi:hypothetical protein